jgi:hypothetical protein
MFIAVMKWDAETGEIAKYASFDTEAEAETHVAAFSGAFPGAFAAEYNGRLLLAAVDLATMTVYENVPPAPLPPVPVVRSPLTALFLLEDGEIIDVRNPCGLGIGFAIDAGVYWLFFAEAMPNADYSYNVSSMHGTAKVTDRQAEYVQVTITDAVSATNEISIQIYRAD